VLAQRLIRTICKNCKEEYEPEKPELFPRDFQYKPGETLWRGTGCRECLNTGYAGRQGMYELMSMTDELRDMILQRKSATQMVPAAKKGGMRLLRDDGWRLVRKGVTTAEEVLRATKA